MTESPNNIQNILIRAVLISFIVGGLTGGVIGAITGGLSQEYIVPWWQEKVLGKSTSNTNTSGTGSVKNVTVEEESQTIATVAEVTPAIGSIIVKQNFDEAVNSTSPFDLFFGTPTQPGEQEVAAGSGFLVTAGGIILTNKHVINVSEAEYTFIMNDGRQFDAELIDVDPFNDVAVLQISTEEDLPYLELGDSDSIETGQTVIAIGNTLSQFHNTVTKGVVSGIGRTITAGDSQGQSETIEEVIQTDAAINPGNSGGPLVNLSGQVVGINTAVSREGQLIGFAIPSNVIRPVIESIQESGRIIRPYIGIRYRLITPEFAEANALSVDYGALLVRSADNELAIIPGSPGDKAGLEENDIILSINGEEINEGNTLSRMMQHFSVGEIITLKIFHDGEEREVDVTLEEYPE
ncbi:MAG: trypsin-like peptidase domain-containing protein [bacterium]|nr:trypsin-like peptidase domain-containing protein [bacterium]